MAVESTYLNLLTTPQLIIHDTDRSDLVNWSNHQGNIANPVYSRPPPPHMVFPLAGNQPVVVCDSSVQPKTSVNTDSTGLTSYNLPPPRKRSREYSIHHHHHHQQFYAAAPPQKNNSVDVSQISSSFIGDHEDSFHQHHLDIDTIISQHAKRIRVELEERQKQEARLLVVAMGEGVLMKKLKEKEEEMERMGKLNNVLEERVKSMYVENQLWRELAQTNEATANSLRTNLEQVLLLHVGGGGGGMKVVEEDVESCCRSSSSSSGGRRDDDDEGGEDKDFGDDHQRRMRISWYGGEKRRRMCTRCGERESCVVLLPCRHLCLCSVCGSGAHQLLRACPVCHSSMNATLHLNTSHHIMSSSSS